MLDVKHAASVALSSALTAWEHGYPPLPDTIQELRVAPSLLTDGEPTADELRPFLGEGWIIRRRCDHRGDRDTNAVTEAEYAVAQIRALAARLGLTEGFVAARVRPISPNIEQASR